MIRDKAVILSLVHYLIDVCGTSVYCILCVRMVMILVVNWIWTGRKYGDSSGLRYCGRGL